MNKYKRNILLSAVMILLSVFLIVNAVIENSEFKISNIVGFVSLLLAGIFLLFINWKNLRTK